MESVAHEPRVQIRCKNRSKKRWHCECETSLARLRLVRRCTCQSKIRAFCHPAMPLLRPLELFASPATVRQLSALESILNEAQDQSLECSYMPYFISVPVNQDELGKRNPGKMNGLMRVQRILISSLAQPTTAESTRNLSAMQPFPLLIHHQVPCRLSLFPAPEELGDGPGTCRSWAHILQTQRHMLLCTSMHILKVTPC